MLYVDSWWGLFGFKEQVSCTSQPAEELYLLKHPELVDAGDSKFSEFAEAFVSKVDVRDITVSQFFKHVE